MLFGQEFDVAKRYAEASTHLQKLMTEIPVTKNMSLYMQDGKKVMVRGFSKTGPKIELKMGNSTIQAPMKWSKFKNMSVADNVLRYIEKKSDETLLDLLIVYKIDDKSEQMSEVMSLIKSRGTELGEQAAIIRQLKLKSSITAKRRRSKSKDKQEEAEKPKYKFLKAHFYLAPNGNDKNPGTKARPFATMAHAITRMQPGQLLYVRGGTFFPKTSTRFRIVGKPDAYFHIHAYPGEVPVFDGTQLKAQNGGMNVTWHFHHAKYIKVKGHIHLTNGRGAGLFVDNESQFLDFDWIEASRNGWEVTRGGHGFYIHGRNISDITFRNCDAHRNANHQTKPGEDVEVNLYQHGDGFRIFEAKNVKMINCRAWHNLDDAYDFTQAVSPILLSNSWAAYSGIDDAQGSLTGTPNKRMRRYEGVGIKVGYDNDTGAHRIERCLSWNNMCHGYQISGGPVKVYNCVSFNNAEVSFFGEDNKANDMRNTFAFKDVYMRPGKNRKRPLQVQAKDFASIDDKGMLGPRRWDGTLPLTGFMRPRKGSRLIDAGVDVDLSFAGKRVDIGCFEYPSKPKE